MAEILELTEELVTLCTTSFCILPPINFPPKETAGLAAKSRYQRLSQLAESLKHGEVNFQEIIRLCNLILLETDGVIRSKSRPESEKDGHRASYTCTSMVKFSALVVATPHGQKLDLDELVKIVDMSLILVGPPRDESLGDSIEQAMRTLEEINNLMEAQSLNESYAIPLPDRFPAPAMHLVTPRALNPIPVCPRNFGMDEFDSHLKFPRDPENLGPEPLVFNNALELSPAVEKNLWTPAYLMSKTIGGRRLVPVETGTSYTADDFGQKIITFNEFMHEAVLADRPLNGYLAQYDFLKQVSSLREDIIIPDYCYALVPPPHHTSPLYAEHLKKPYLEEIQLNAWFGPAGTVSPLHVDPYHNLLAQVVGRKYVRLYAPNQSHLLYPRGYEDDINMCNTSAADIALLSGWTGTVAEQLEAHAKFPRFKEAYYVDCILEPGQSLYIPVGWWHYVQSLSISFSVSFWWNHERTEEEDAQWRADCPSSESESGSSEQSSLMDMD